MEQLREISNTMAAYLWQPQNITFSHVVCNVESPEHISLILAVDNKTEIALSKFVARLESAITMSGANECTNERTGASLVYNS